MAVRLAALLLLASVLWDQTLANTDMAVDCCVDTTNRKLPFRLVKDYTIQSIIGGCPLPATVLITQKGLRLCVPPPTKNNWVARIIRKLNKTNPKGGKKETEKTRTKKQGNKRRRGGRA